MRQHRVSRAERHPCLAHVVVLIAENPLHAIEAPAYALETDSADVMLDQLAARAVLAGLKGGEVAALLVSLGFKST